ARTPTFIIVLFTDSLNTMNRWYGDSYDTTTQVTRVTPPCSAIKSTGFTIFRSASRAPSFGLPGKGGEEKAKRKSPAAAAGLLHLKGAGDASVSGDRRELGHHAFQRLECPLGEIAVETRNLLGVGHESLVSGLGKFALRFERLVERLHARELLHERLGVLIGLLGVVAIGVDDCGDTALQRSRMRNRCLELLLAVALNIFNFEHRWNPFPRLSRSRENPDPQARADL